MKAVLLGTIFATVSFLPAFGCNHYDGYDAAVGQYYSIHTDPSDAQAAGLAPDNTEFIFVGFEGERFFCNTRYIASGMLTRSAICVSEDGEETTSSITWVQFEDNPMLRAAVFQGYVFYPGCDI